MLKFLLDKFRTQSGPLKEARLVVGDIIEEAVEMAGHYVKKLRRNPEEPPPVPEPSPAAPEVESQPEPKPEPSQPEISTKSTKPAPKTKKAAKKSKAAKKKEPPRSIEVSDELARALDNAANRRKQEFKVLSILWDTRHRNMGGMSAKALSDHGVKLGLAIRHENIRKVIKMRLSNHVEILQERGDRSSINHYCLNDEGAEYFKGTYLKQQ